MWQYVQKIVSYLLPIKLHTFQTEHSGTLAVTLFNGKKMLDTAISNYSYGPLQRILHKALKKLPFDPSTQNILVLGMGAGSIIETIRKNFGSNAHMTLVEFDAAIISVAEKEFGMAAFSDIKIIHADAIGFMRTNNKQFDLVIVDLFVIDTIPGACTEADFLNQISQSLAHGSKLVYNTIRDTLPAATLGTMITVLNSFGVHTRILKKIESSNDIILGEKQLDS